MICLVCKQAFVSNVPHSGHLGRCRAAKMVPVQMCACIWTLSNLGHPARGCLASLDKLWGSDSVNSVKNGSHERGHRHFRVAAQRATCFICRTFRTCPKAKARCMRLGIDEAFVNEANLCGFNLQMLSEVPSQASHSAKQAGPRESEFLTAQLYSLLATRLSCFGASQALATCWSCWSGM